MNFQQDLLQGWMDANSRQWQKDRADTGQLTLGKLIKELEQLDPERVIVGFGKPYSYRGYYIDLSFEPEESSQRVTDLLKTARGCMGKVFEGYKGGDYVMHENTPLWLSPYGYSSGLKIIGLDYNSAVIHPVLEKEE